MKKAMMLIGFFAVVLLSLSAYTDRVVDSSVGHLAPEITLSGFDADSTIAPVRLGDMRGQYVVLHFWNALSAPSRIKASSLNALQQRLGERLCLISVNTDNSERLFREIVRRDRLTASTQFRATDPGRLADLYDVDPQAGTTYLVAPDGHISAVNPSSEEIISALKAR